MYNHRKHLLIVVALVILSTFGMYFVLRGMFNNQLPIVASAEAVPIDTLFNAHMWVIAALFSLIIVFLLYSVVVFRRREGDEGDGEYMHGNTALEVAWTIAPIGLVLVFAFWGSNMLVEITRDDPNALIVEVEGFQWGWRYYYPEQNVTSTSLFLPANKPVKLVMNSVDVLHSFWVPEFRVKQDLIPGRETVLRFTPTRPTYDEPYKVRCAEICGTSHAYMLSDVHVLEDMTAYEQRVVDAGKLPSDPVDRGALWYEQYSCNGCHSLDGSLDGYAGPTWLNIYEREQQMEDGTVVISDDDYLRDSILNPNGQIVAGYAAGQMPQNFGDQFAEKENELAGEGFADIDIINDLIEFMKTVTE